jgi:hypothetical protein
MKQGPGAQGGGFNMNVNLVKGGAEGRVEPMNYDGFAEDGDAFGKKNDSAEVEDEY